MNEYSQSKRGGGGRNKKKTRDKQLMDERIHWKQKRGGKPPKNEANSEWLYEYTESINEGGGSPKNETNNEWTKEYIESKRKGEKPKETENRTKRQRQQQPPMVGEQDDKKNV